VSQILRALEAPRRREILRLVWDQERAAGEIHASFPGVTFGAISQHLRLLRETGLVTQRKSARQRFYRARPQGLGELRAWLESTWDSALYRLKLAAELEAGRRGPRPHSPRPRGKQR
jgi:DNA-binding transcriptional ArsR family regulator